MHACGATCGSCSTPLQNEQLRIVAKLDNVRPVPSNETSVAWPAYLTPFPP